MTNKTIPFVDLKAQYLSIKSEIDKAIASVVGETAFIGGKYVKQFEEQFAALYGVDYCVSVANGTDSLYIIMKMLGIGAGDEVITSAYSWISSSETISQTGATPIFADIEEAYFTLDPAEVEKKISPATKALLIVHIHGQPCDLDRFQAICLKHNIHLIEDCAQSHFSAFKDQRAGTVGIASSFSFYPGKNLGAYGDAGCILTNNAELAAKFRMYANHGALKKHEHQIEGINSRLDGLQAAILTAKLPFILNWTEARIKNAALYDSLLVDIPGFQIPARREEGKHSYHLYVAKATKRNELKAYLAAHQVETAIHYPTALPNLPCYSHLPKGSYPVATANEQQLLSLPMYAELSEEEIRRVAYLIKEFYQT